MLRVTLRLVAFILAAKHSVNKNKGIAFKVILSPDISVYVEHDELEPALAPVQLLQGEVRDQQATET